MKTRKNSTSVLLDVLGLRQGTDYKLELEPELERYVYALTPSGYNKIEDTGKEKLLNLGVMFKDRTLYAEHLREEGIRAYYMHDALGQHAPEIFALSNGKAPKGYLMQLIHGYCIDDLFRGTPRDGVLEVIAGQSGEKSGQLVRFTKSDILDIKDQLDEILNLLYKNKRMHGDIHEGNLLLSYEGKGVVLIDPWWGTVGFERLDTCVRGDSGSISRMKDWLDELISKF